MEWLQIIIAGFTGTSLMTLFSYICGAIFNEEFSEPKLLNRMMHYSRAFSSDITDDDHRGWIIHFGIGQLMAFWLWIMYCNSGLGHAQILGAFLGVMAGMAGALGWLFLFNTLTTPRDTDIRGFVVQLVVAHSIFGWSAYLLYQLWNPC
ncbi:hypothetical protein PP178_14070 [Zeaxanthinibacter sp. PT1]|uniref:hypothetical protein n=1 Tax=Zeaxanthinibacter TaxID=561554 RepID=UPI0023493097|nr:hypothetical protein [Zeaxanthinibacter sp. PT1]MDC6352684.1 hypothetical protein [Zeaxanthinibacter sp. PT1]